MCSSLFLLKFWKFLSVLRSLWSFCFVWKFWFLIKCLFKCHHIYNHFFQYLDILSFRYHDQMLFLNVYERLRYFLVDFHDGSIYLVEPLLVISSYLQIIVLSNTVVRFWLLLVHSIICEMDNKKLHLKFITHNNMNRW